MTLSYTSWRRVCARQKKPKRRPRSTRSACSAQKTARIGWRSSRRKSRDGAAQIVAREGAARCRLPAERSSGRRAQTRPAAAVPAARNGRRAKTVFPAGPPPRPVLYADRILRAPPAKLPGLHRQLRFPNGARLRRSDGGRRFNPPQAASYGNAANGRKQAYRQDETLSI